MLVRARKQELLVRKIKISAVGIRHKRENPLVFNRSCLLEVARGLTPLVKVVRGLELAVLYIFPVSPSPFDNEQTGFVMPSLLQSLCHPAAAASLNGFAERDVNCLAFKILVTPLFVAVYLALYGTKSRTYNPHSQSKQVPCSGDCCGRVSGNGICTGMTLW